MILNYILDENHNPVPCENIIQWGEFMESGHRIVEKTELAGVEVSPFF